MHCESSCALCTAITVGAWRLSPPVLTWLSAALRGAVFGDHNVMRRDVWGGEWTRHVWICLLLCAMLMAQQPGLARLACLVLLGFLRCCPRRGLRCRFLLSRIVECLRCTVIVVSAGVFVAAARGGRVRLWHTAAGLSLVASTALQRAHRAGADDGDTLTNSCWVAQGRWNACWAVAMVSDGSWAARHAVLHGCTGLWGLGWVEASCCCHVGGCNCVAPCMGYWLPPSGCVGSSCMLLEHLSVCLSVVGLAA